MSNLKSQSRALRRMVPGDCNAQLKKSPCGVLKKATTGRLFPGSAVDRLSSMSTISSSPMDGCQAGSAKKRRLRQTTGPSPNSLVNSVSRCLDSTDAALLLQTLPHSSNFTTWQCRLKIAATLCFFSQCSCDPQTTTNPGKHGLIAKYTRPTSPPETLPQIAL
jgi:hypothetical protein